MIEQQDRPIVSIVIVSMNNIAMLRSCLNSFKENTHIAYEIIVVAYLFSDRNFLTLTNEYPWVKIIRNNELTGFSANNNLALRQANGDYCLVVNDDTLHTTSLVDKLVEDINSLPDDVAVISPSFWNVDGTLQSNGRPKLRLSEYFLSFYLLGGLLNYARDHWSKYTNQKGIYQTYNLSGACFLIKTEIFRKLGWFDERYFFCPEDIALSTTLNKIGYKCYVDSDIKITHLGGQSSNSYTQIATYPAKVKGEYIWYCENSLFKKFFFLTNCIFLHTIFGVYHLLRYSFLHNERSYILKNTYLSVVKTIFSSKSPKQIFVEYYKKISDIKSQF